MSVSRKYVDPVTGIRYPTQSERSQAMKARETENSKAEVRRQSEAARYDDPYRLDNAASAMRLVREGVAVPYVPTTPVTPIPPSTRQFVGLAPENIPPRTTEGEIETDLHRLAKK